MNLLNLSLQLKLFNIYNTLAYIECNDILSALVSDACRNKEETYIMFLIHNYIAVILLMLIELN